MQKTSQFWPAHGHVAHHLRLCTNNIGTELNHAPEVHTRDTSERRTEAAAKAAHNEQPTLQAEMFLSGLAGPCTQPVAWSTSDALTQHSQHNAVGAVIVTPEASNSAGAVWEHRHTSRSVDLLLQEATDSRATPHAIHSTVDRTSA